MKTITTLKDTRLFLTEVISKLGAAFHPDTEFEYYVDSEGNPIYSTDKAIELNRNLAECFEVCDNHDEDIYDLCLDILNELTTFYYSYHDERGEFRADVSLNDKTVWETEGYDIFEDGFMKHKDDINGLREYLISLNIITEDDKLMAA